MDPAKVQKFLNMKNAELKAYLRARSVPVSGEKNEDLAEMAYWADKLGLAVKLTDKEAEQDINSSKRSKLVLAGGLVALPRPESLSSGWEASPTSFPDTTRSNIDSYVRTVGRRVGLHNTEGVRTLGLGKGLYLSKHVREMAFHGINPDISYCYVRAQVIPQTNTSENPYFSWVVLNKDSGQVVTAECNCTVGIQAGCKHVTALLFAVVEAVEGGRNKSSTSQKMVWDAPPKKKKPVHEAKFAEDIKVLKVKQDASSQHFEETSKAYRSRFDPRVLPHRNFRPLENFDLDSLAQITNGKTGLLMYTKVKPDPVRQQPNPENFIEDEIEIETTVEAPTVEEAYTNALKDNSLPQNLAEKIINQLRINTHQQRELASSTSKQASCPQWQKHRTGRITSSVVGDCCTVVMGNPMELKTTHSIVAKIMGYYGSPTSPALQWGKDRESEARKHYIALHKLKEKHSGVTCSETGLWVSLSHPFIAASPDGLVTCNKCGYGLLEVKNPYTNRGCSITELVQEKASAGLICENGTIHLDRTHKYFGQVQTQMFATGYKWCDFVVKTYSPKDNIHVERIFFDQQFINRILPKIEFFFCNAIIPELTSRAVKDKVVSDAVSKTIQSILRCLERSDTLSDDIQYPCIICRRECESDPINSAEQSVGCDKCLKWCHFCCAGLTGNEPFLNKRKSSWKCNNCRKRKK